MVRKAVVGVGILMLAKAALAVIPLEGTRLAGTGEMEFWGGGGVSLDSGYSVAVAADGTTALVGGLGDGAARVLTLAGGVWSRQSDIPAPNDRVGAGRGCVVAVSADGNTALVGCPWDNAEVGAVWVYARSGGMWSQQGPKLIGTGAAVSAHQGYSVALSADGSTAIVGGPGDGTDNGAQMGAAWVFTRFGGVWTQQGEKLVGRGVVGNSAGLGYSVALSADGNTAMVGGPWDDWDWDRGCVGAAWVFVRSDGVWTQQGEKLVGGDAGGSYHRSFQGSSVALSADGSTSLVGGPHDSDGSNQFGATWVFTRSEDGWTQQGPKLVGSNTSGRAYQGSSVAISGDGNTAVIGGPRDDSGSGATWVFTRSQELWSQKASKLVGGGAVGTAQQGTSVAITPDASTIFVGGPFDGESGAAWVFSTTSTAWVPVVAHIQGMDGAGWRSDLGMLNTGGTVANVELTFFSSDGAVSNTIYQPAGVQSILSDVVGQLDASGQGALAIVSDQPLHFTARTYHQAAPDVGCFPDGTYGQEHPVLVAGNGLAAGNSAVLPALVENDRYRSNIGLINMGDEAARVLVELYDGAGTKLAEYTVGLAHGQWRQTSRPFETRAGQTAMDRGYARITVQSGSGVVAIASVVDNLTNDPTTVTMQRD